MFQRILCVAMLVVAAAALSACTSSPVIPPFETHIVSAERLR